VGTPASRQTARGDAGGTKVLESVPVSEDQFTFSYAVLYDGSRAVGFAPVFIMTLQAWARGAGEAPVRSLAIPAANLPFPVRSASPCSSGRLVFRRGMVGVLPGHRHIAPHCFAFRIALEAEGAIAGTLQMIIWKGLSPPLMTTNFHWLTKQRRLFSDGRISGDDSAENPALRERRITFSSLKAHPTGNTLKREVAGASGERVEIDVENRPAPPTMRHLDAIFFVCAGFRQTFEKAQMKFERAQPPIFSKISASQSPLPLSSCCGNGPSQEHPLHSNTLLSHRGDRTSSTNSSASTMAKTGGSGCSIFRLWDATVWDWGVFDGRLPLDSRAGQTGYGRQDRNRTSAWCR